MIINLHSRAALAAGLLAGAVLLVPGLTKANAQDLAAAAPAAITSAHARPGYVVFFEPNGTQLSGTAAETIRLAARSAQASKAPIVRVVGSPQYAEAVQQQLVLQGVQPTSIALVGRDDSNPVVRASTGVAEPANRRVLIAF